MCKPRIFGGMEGINNTITQQECGNAKSVRISSISPDVESRLEFIADGDVFVMLAYQLDKYGDTWNQSSIEIPTNIAKELMSKVCKAINVPLGKPNETKQ